MLHMAITASYCSKVGTWNAND